MCLGSLYNEYDMQDTECQFCHDNPSVPKFLFEDACGVVAQSSSHFCISGDFEWPSILRVEDYSIINVFSF